MRRLRAASFSSQWKKRLGWKPGSRVVVLLENRWDWDCLPEKFRESFLWYHEVLFLEIDTGGIRQRPQMIREWMEKLSGLRLEALVGVGSFSLLQRVLLLREKLESEQIPVLLFSGRDRWQALFREDLWIRGSDGETEYWGYVGKHEMDALVMTQKGEFCDDVPDAFAKELDRFRRAIQEVYGSGTEETERDLCYELAEPLRVVCGIPMETGIYFSLLYLYRLLSTQEQEKACGLLGAGAERPDWKLEGMAQAYRREETAGILLSPQDVPLLTQMAMEGIENDPAGQQLGWESFDWVLRQNREDGIVKE